MSQTVYLTASEVTGLSLLPLGCVLGFGLIAIAYNREPKEPTSPTGQMKEPILTKKHYLMLWGAAACYVAVVIFAGPTITNFAVSHGVFLDFEQDPR